MSQYQATVRHSSICSHYSIPVGDDLTTAKRKAVVEFGDGFVDHDIVIMDSETREIVASRKVGGGQWTE